VRIEDEYVGPLAAAESLDRRRSGVAGGRPDDRRPSVPPRQGEVHQPPQPLHGEILERQRRSVEQFQQKKIVVDLNQRRLRRVPEPTIGILRHRSEFARRKLVAHERLDDPRRGGGVGNTGERADRFGRHTRDLHWRV